MAERWLVATGDIETAGNWNGGTLPSSSDDLYANGFTGTITASRTALSWRTTAGTTAVAGGGFTCSVAGTNIGGNIIAGTTQVLAVTNTSGTVAITGNVTGSTTNGVSSVAKSGGAGAFSHVGNSTGGGVTNAVGITVSAGVFSGTGDYTGGTGFNTFGVSIVSTSSHTIVGNGVGGSILDSNGIQYAASTGSLAITGNVTAGAGGRGILISGAGSTTTISGDATGGSGTGAMGCNLTGAGTVTIGGNAVGGTNSTITATCFGAYNSGAGSLTVTGYAIGAPSGGVVAGVFGSLAGTTTVGSVRCSTTCVNGIAGKVVLANLTTGTLQAANAAATVKTFYPTDFSGLLPAAGDVRLGAVYNLMNSNGTAAIPSAANVLNGVSVDATTGTYVVVSTANVRSGTTFGAAFALTGTLAVPSAANVLSGVSVDATTGTYVVVAVGNVRNGTTFGPASASTGTLVLPAIEDVQVDVTYGAGGNEFTGTLETGGDPEAIAAAVWAYTTRGLTEAVELDSVTAAKIAKIEAVVSGTVTGAGTSTEVFVGPSATVTVTVDASGNRSQVVVS